MEKILTYERLREVLHYDPDSGIFTRRIKTNQNQIIGQEVGSLSQGYLLISIDSKLYGAQRLAWLYMEGYMPEFEIDHKDRNPSNNMWENLRHVTHTCNMKNKSKYINNKSGITGVSQAKDGKWVAQIQVNKVKIYIGCFPEIIDAVKARWKAEVRYGFPNCNTTSSAYQYLKKRSLI